MNSKITQSSQKNDTGTFRRIGFFFHPLPLGAIALMAINDHYLKYAYPGLITGKLSDFMGVFYFPIFLCALCILLLRLPLSLPMIIGSIVSTDMIMIAMKLSPAFSSWLESIFGSYFFKIQIINDPLDLVALMMSSFSFLYLARALKTNSAN